jgi:hypothetical protein
VCVHNRVPAKTRPAWRSWKNLPFCSIGRRLCLDNGIQVGCFLCTSVNP